MSRKTRREKAVELLERAQRGPSIDIHVADYSRLGITAEQADKIAEQYAARFRGWSESWLLPLLYDLVPELRGQDKIAAALERVAKVGGNR